MSRTSPARPRTKAKETPSSGNRVPLYRSVASTLQAEIARDVYAIGERLPSETDLMRRFGVSRHTVRIAIRNLQEAGIVKSHQGLGTIVHGVGAGHGYTHKINKISDLFPAGAETRYDRVGRKLVALPAWALSFGGLDPKSTWLRITGDRRKPGMDAPFNELEVYLAARYARLGSSIRPDSASIYVLLEKKFGETIREVEQVVGGFTADGVRGARIGLAQGEIGMEVRRIHRVSSDNAVGLVSFNRYRIDEYSFSLVLRRSDS